MHALFLVGCHHPPESVSFPDSHHIYGHMSWRALNLPTELCTVPSLKQLDVEWHILTYLAYLVLACFKAIIGISRVLFGIVYRKADLLLFYFTFFCCKTNWSGIRSILSSCSKKRGTYWDECSKCSIIHLNINACRLLQSCNALAIMWTVK